MKGLYTLLVAPVLAGLAFGAHSQEQRDTLAPLRFAPRNAKTNGGYIVVLKEDADPHAQVAALAPSLRTSGGSSVNRVFNGVLKGYAGKFDEATLKTIRKSPQVDYVEPDFIVTTAKVQTGADYGLAISSQKKKTPWLQQTKYYYKEGGKYPVTVYVIDTGIYPAHSDFAGGRAKIVANFVSSENNEDENGHGTHVAGIVGGKTWGIAKNVTIASIKVLDWDGAGTTSTVITGVNYAVRHCSGGRCIMNLSLGGGKSDALNQAIDNAVAAGVTVVSAAGNTASDACFTSPASAAGSITVSAIDFAYDKPDWANYGSCAHVFAPGDGIESAWVGHPTMSHAVSGTSQAAPHVAGIAAYYMSFDGISNPAAVKANIIKKSQLGQVLHAQGTPNRIANNGYWLA